MALLTFADYARHRGISKQAVSLAVKEGRISVVVDPVNGGRKIDPEVADHEWVKNSDQDMVRNQSTRGKPKKPQVVHQPGAIPNQAKEKGIPPLADSKAIKEAFLARIAKLQYEIQSKSLIPVEEVRKSAFNTARIVRDSLLNLPDRIAHELAAETDPHKIHFRITEEIIQALEELTRVKTHE